MKVSHCIGGLRYFVFLDIYAFPCNDFIEQKYVMPGGLTRLYICFANSDTQIPPRL